MVVLFWVAGVLLVLLGVPSAIFFALHLATGEPVPLARARALFHWVVVVALGTFDIAIFTKVVQGLIAIW
jgi:cytochrome b subunit of formate dehydrogenase